MFDRIEPNKNKSVKVAEQIVEAVRSGGLEPGARLPSEHELAKKMDVSRPSVREALSGLQALGLVETKTGFGTFISEAAPESNLIGTDLSILKGEISYLHMIEARKNLENTMLSMAIDHLRAEGIERGEEALSRMKEHSTEREYEDYMDADHDFHEAIVRLTANPLVVKAAQPLLATINDSLYRELTHKYYLVDDTRIKRCFNTHKELFQAIKGEDLESARDLIARHWQLMEDALEREER